VRIIAAASAAVPISCNKITAFTVLTFPIPLFGRQQTCCCDEVAPVLMQLARALVLRNLLAVGAATLALRC
jgi:hypothetical protein